MVFHLYVQDLVLCSIFVYNKSQCVYEKPKSPLVFQHGAYATAKHSLQPNQIECRTIPT